MCPSRRRDPCLCVQGTTEALILDEGRVNKFNKRFATMGAYGQVGWVAF